MSREAGLVFVLIKSSAGYRYRREELVEIAAQEAG